MLVNQKAYTKVKLLGVVVYKRYLFLVLIGSGYNLINGMHQLKAMTAIVMARVRATPRAVQEKVLEPIDHEAQRTACATKCATCALGQFAEEKLGCVRRRKSPQVSKNDD